MRKGDIFGIFYRKRVLVIDGKNNNDDVLMGETDRPSTGKVEPVWGCLNNPSHLEWTTLTSLTAPLAALRSSMKTRERIDLS
jgi:hypothetical protein